MPAPNIVVIMTDDDSIDTLAHQPKIQSLMVDEGTSFDYNYSASPVCGASRSSFLTGQLPLDHGVLNNANAWDTFRDNLYQENDLFAWLDQAGYDTALFGKYLNDFTQTGNYPPHIDNFQAFTNGQGYYDQQVNVNGNTTVKSQYSTDFFGQRATNYITSHASDADPFFILYTPIGPHVVPPANPAYPIPANRHDDVAVSPFVPSPTWAPGDMGNSHYNFNQAAILWRERVQTTLSIGDQVENIINALAATGELENTYIIFTSDNGFSIGDHGLYGKGNPYEISAKTYLVIRGPGINAGETLHNVTSTTDLTATILDLADATPTLEQYGSSLMPLFSDPNAPWREVTDIQFLNDWTATVTNDDKIKTITYSNGNIDTFDLINDPFELNDLTPPAQPERHTPRHHPKKHHDKVYHKSEFNLNSDHEFKLDHEFTMYDFFHHSNHPSLMMQ